MPYTLQTEHTPSGAPITRMTVSGTIDVVEATSMMKEIGPNGPHGQLPMLIITDDSTDVTAAARRIFTTNMGSDAARISATVITNVVLRVTTNFINRVNRSTHTRTFANAAQALEWLDLTLKDRDAEKPSPH
jgi:hypothetical protein